MPHAEPPHEAAQEEVLQVAPPVQALPARACRDAQAEEVVSAAGAAEELLRTARVQSARMRRALAAAVIFVALATLVVTGCDASRSPDEPELGTLLDRVVAAGAPGVLVVVRDAGEVRSVARGFADRGRSRRMRAADRFRIGSVTKTFVATLVLRLAEDGRLKLDDPVEHWLPGLIPGGRAITVRQLLSHTSGLFDYIEDARVFRETDRRWTPSELIALAVRHPPRGPLPGGASRIRARTTSCSA